MQNNMSRKTKINSETKIIDEELKVEEELKKETQEFNAKIFNAQAKSIEKDIQINEKLSKDLENSKQEAIKKNEHYEELRAKSLELESLLKEKEELEKFERLNFLEEKAEKQARISDKELRNAEEFIKKAYHIKEAKDELNNAIDSRREEYKSQQIGFSEKTINKLENEKNTKSKETSDIINKIHIQKEFVKTRYSKDRRIAAEMKEKADIRLQELNKSIKVLEKKKTLLANKEDKNLLFNKEMPTKKKKNSSK